MILSLLRRLRHGPLRFLNPVWILLGRLFRAIIGRSGLFVSQDIGGYGPFRLDVRYAFSDFSQWGADRHNDGFSGCVEACRSASCVFDIGAHIGLVSLPMASVLPASARLISFEPSEANRNLLRRHVERNGLGGTVTIEETLVGEECRNDVPFFEMDDPSGMNSVAATSKTDQYRQVSKQQTSVDAYCKEHGLLPSLMKIDVEGAEIGVLRGAAKTVERAQPVIYLSYHPRHVESMGYSVDDLSTFLDRVNYECRHVDGSPVETFALREYVLSPKHSGGPAHSSGDGENARCH